MKLKFASKISTLSRLSLLLAATVMATRGSAQSAEEVFSAYFKDWYQVELLIFERIEAASSDPESWPKNLSLAYPPNLELLISAEELRRREEEVTHRQLTNAVAAAGDSEENRRLLEQLKKGNIDDPFYQKLINSIEKSEIERLTPKEKPFVHLDKDIRRLNREARLLGRDRAMRILFHQAWRQPIRARDKAVSLVITGGDQFDENFELEGSVNLFVGRYLHIHTNLWLAQFEANFGQPTEHWPLPPAIPGPVTFSNEPLTAGGQAQNDQQWNISLENNSERLDFAATNAADILGDYTRLTQRPYVVKHIVTIQQKRRMRSGELHYLDHPKLGLLIRIDKYEPQFDQAKQSAGL